MVVVASEDLGRVDDREGHSASGDCEDDSDKYEDFSHRCILSKALRVIPHVPKACEHNRTSSSSLRVRSQTQIRTNLFGSCNPPNRQVRN
jgi:hypothetical protein